MKSSSNSYLLLGNPFYHWNYFLIKRKDERKGKTVFFYQKFRKINLEFKITDIFNYLTEMTCEDPTQNPSFDVNAISFNQWSIFSIFIRTHCMDLNIQIFSHSQRGIFTYKQYVINFRLSLIGIKSSAIQSNGSVLFCASRM